MAVVNGKVNGREPHFLQLCDLPRYHSAPDGSLTYDERIIQGNDVCKYVAPYDFSAWIRFVRVLQKAPLLGSNDWPLKGVVNEALAVTMEVDLFTIGAKLYIRQGKGKDRTIKIILEDADGRTLLAEFER